MMMSKDFLKTIIEQKKILNDEKKVFYATLKSKLADLDVTRYNVFKKQISRDNKINLIAEIKKASPSKGLIREDFDPILHAAQYEKADARCISVLTDEPYFQGSLENLRRIRAAVDLPLLRKDFILDAYQLLEARAAGADAVLLIAECLDDCNLRALHNEAIEMGMTPLVELYEPENLPRVLAAGATVVGINNRDLKTFEVDLQHTVRLAAKIPDECTIVGESGIRTAADVALLAAGGVDAILVGESLMASPDIGVAVDALLGRVGRRAGDE